MSTLAQQLIAENKATKNPFLDLGNCGLTELPDELFDCVWLENLNLGTDYYDEKEQVWQESRNKGYLNQLKTLKKKETLLSKLNIFNSKKNLASLEKLRILSLNKNKVADISCVQALTNLNILAFRSNQITNISCLQQLSNLNDLHFSSNQVEDISCLQKLNNLSYLYFSSNQVSDISCIGDLINLMNLDFSSNKVIDISCLQRLTSLRNLGFTNNQVVDISCLRELSSLVNLDFNSNQVSDISYIERLSNLKELRFWRNQVVDISYLKALVNLNTLYFSSNQVEDISCLQGLTNLSILDFSSNQVIDISYLKSLTNLTELGFSANKVVDISCLQNLNNLKTLYFGGNQVVDISCLKDLSNLKTLYFGANQIMDIFYLQELRNLQELYFKATPAFLRLPKEYQSKYPNILDNQIEVLQYWLDNFGNKSQKDGYFREAKVVFVGEGDIGKTSLIQVLLGQPLTERGRTHKIEITTNKTLFSYVAPSQPSPQGRELKTPLPFGEGQGVGLRGLAEPLTIHFWDFGGQEIMHATHKFFMTERSVYVLVVNGRKDNDDHEKWLEQLKMTCGDSPIILVANKMDKLEDKQQLPIHTLKDQYPQIRCVIETSCGTTENKTTRGIKELQTEIQAALQTLTHFEEPFAPKYFAVKEKLQASNKNYIDYRQYAQTCEEVAKELNQDFNESSQSVLSDVLNYLGIMLNFRKKDEKLEELYVFKPEWIIDGVYQIINSEAIQNSKGKITETEVFRLLKAAGYQSQQEKDFIVRMMQHFELAFPKTSFNELYYLVPSVFALDKPQELTAYWASKKPVLHFRFQYGTWHNNIVSYFLVQQHEKIKGEYFWRNGAILCYANNEVLVEANRYDKTISLQVFGEKDKRYALWQVREALEKVHTKIFDKAKLEITEFVIYEHEGKQYPISHEELLRYKAKNRMYWISEIDKELDANELLGEIDLSDKEKVFNELGKLQLAKNQVDRLVDAAENTNAVEFFELLDSFGIKGFRKSSLRDEFISGVYKTDANYWQKLLVFVKSL